MAYLLQLDDAPLVAEEPVKVEEEPAKVADEPVQVAEEPVKAEASKPAKVEVPKPATSSKIPTPTTADDEWPADDDRGDENAPSEAYFTETLARIYIKQGKYDKAIEIIRRLSLNYPKKSRYFADQIRFLGKIILNEKAKNKEK